MRPRAWPLRLGARVWNLLAGQHPRVRRRRPEPVHPAINWQDQRCAEAARQLEDGPAPTSRGSSAGRSRSTPRTRSAGRCGCSRRIPHVDRTRWILSPKDFCIAALTGCGAIGPGLACRTRRSRWRIPRRRLRTRRRGGAEVSPLDEFDATAADDRGRRRIPPRTAGERRHDGRLELDLRVRSRRAGPGRAHLGNVRDRRPDGGRPRVRRRRHLLPAGARPLPPRGSTQAGGDARAGSPNCWG